MISCQYPSIQEQKNCPNPSLNVLRGNLPQINSVFYTDRRLIESLCYEAIEQPGVQINIRAPKQMGKTHLMNCILSHARSEGYHTVSVNLQLVNTEILQDLEHLLQWFSTRISKQLGLPSICDYCNYNSLCNKSNITDYFEEIILPNLAQPLVIAIDEINQLFAYPDIAREFLLLLRIWSDFSDLRSVRANIKGIDSLLWDKIRLITVHSTEVLLPSSIEPYLLNNGLVIELPEFTLAQVQKLAECYGLEIVQEDIKRMMILLGGHPYRLQLAFYSLKQELITLEELLNNSEIALTIYAEHLEEQWWNLQRYPYLEAVFTQIVRQSNPVEGMVEQCSRLYKMGLAKQHWVLCCLSCELFRPFFLSRLL